VEWFKPFAAEVLRVLTEDGSFVLNIGGSWNPGSPTRSLYQYKLLIALVEEVGFHLAQECYWYNPAKMPVPAEWVTVRRVRVKDSVEHVWWLSKSKHPKATNLNVLNRYSADMIRLNSRGLKETVRPSGHVINKSWDKLKGQGSIPGNVIEEVMQHMPDDMLKFGNNSANDTYTLRCKEAGIQIHPARFPERLPEFFIRMLTSPGDVVLDIFAGSNTTGAVAEREGRRWLSFELDLNYVAASAFRFDHSDTPAATVHDIHNRILCPEEGDVAVQGSQLSMFEEPPHP
ncbi:MAG: site-specific DNA-methyltransferase, partial [Chthoniobacteraceae bacterium]